MGTGLSKVGGKAIYHEIPEEGVPPAKPRDQQGTTGADIRTGPGRARRAMERADSTGDMFVTVGQLRAAYSDNVKKSAKSKDPAVRAEAKENLKKLKEDQKQAKQLQKEARKAEQARFRSYSQAPVRVSTQADPWIMPRGEALKGQSSEKAQSNEKAAMLADPGDETDPPVRTRTGPPATKRDTEDDSASGYVNFMPGVGMVSPYGQVPKRPSDEESS